MKNAVLAYMEKKGIPVREKNDIIVSVDEGCDMAMVELNGTCVMLGNFWDFRPEVHGIKLRFGSHDSLAEVLSLGLQANQREVQVTRNEEWEYED